MRSLLARLAFRWPWVASVAAHTLVLGGGVLLLAHPWRAPEGPQLALRVQVAALAQAASAPPETPEVEWELLEPPPVPLPNPPLPLPDPPPVVEDLPPLSEEEDPSAEVPDLLRPPAPGLRARGPAAAQVAVARPQPPPPPAAPRATPPAAPPGPLSSASAGAPLVEGAVPYGTNRPPMYPPASRAGHQQGTVVLRLDLDASGAVTQVWIELSSGHPLLDEAARTAALGWRFQPARLRGVPVPVTLRQRVRFALDA